MSALNEVIREYKDAGGSIEVAKKADAELKYYKRIRNAALLVTKWKPRGLSASVDELHNALGNTKKSRIKYR